MSQSIDKRIYRALTPHRRRPNPIAIRKLRALRSVGVIGWNNRDRVIVVHTGQTAHAQGADRDLPPAA